MNTILKFVDGWTEMVQCVASIERVSAHLSTHIIIKRVACKDSKYNWLKFTTVYICMLTFFYLIVFQIDATSPYLYGYISPKPYKLTRTPSITLKGHYVLGARILAIPYTIIILWNLDFLLPPIKYLSWFNITSDVSTGLCHSHLPTSDILRD